MKIKRNRRIKFSRLILPIVVALAVVFGIHYYFYNSYQNVDNTGTNSGIESSTETQEAGETIKEAAINSDREDSKATGSAESESSDSEKSEVSVSITRADLSQNGDTFQVRALIEATVSSGSCTLTMTKGSKVVSKMADVQSLASTSTCKGFDIDVDELSSGEWTIKLDFSSESLAGSAKKEVSI